MSGNLDGHRDGRQGANRDGPDLHLANLRETYRKRRDERARRERRRLIVFAVIVVLILAAMTVAENLWASPAPYDANAVDAALAHWIRRAPRHPLSVSSYRSDVAAAIAESSARHALPAELVTAIVCRESSGRQTARGLRGEIGLMQVHPDTAVRFRCRMSTPAEQVECGCRVLARHLSRCGTLPGALAAYGSRSGSCTPPRGGGVERMVGDRLALAARLRAVMDGGAE